MNSPLRNWIIVFAAYALLGGVVSLLGWYFNMPRLTDWYGSGIAMFANTAAAAVLTAVAILLSLSGSIWSTRISSALGLLVAFVGGGTLFQHLSGINLGIDTLLIEPAWGLRAAVSPGRIGPPASTSFLLLGIALILRANPRTRRAAPILGIGVIAISTLALMGYLFKADHLYSVARYTGIAMQTASIILALGVAMVILVPEHQPLRTLRENSAAGVLARRALPFIVLLPILLGWLRVWGQNAGLYDTGMGTALLVLLLIVILCALLWWCAAAVSVHAGALRQKEEALRESDERLRAAMEVGRLGTYDHDLVGGRMLWSATTLKLFGIAADETPSMELWQSRIHPEDRDRVMNAVRQSIAPDSSGAFGAEYRILLPNGRTHWVEARGAVFFAEQDGARRPIRATGTVLDKTEWKHAQEVLQSADRRKDEFLAMVSHELRTPLTSMLGWIKLLASGRLPPEKAAHGLQVIDRNIKVQTQLIDDLLDISRIVAGKMRLAPRQIDLGAVIDAAVESVRPALQAREIDLQLFIEPLQVVGDPDRLQQVVWNLLTNAIKFTPGKGRVTLTVSRSGAHAKIVVRDNGRGISPAFLPHIFNRFEQADSSTTRTAGGLGLGLSIARHLVELHGGTISVESAGIGQGAAFTIEIPIRPAIALERTAPHTPRRSPAGAAPELHGLRILVVDDDADTCDLLTVMLKLRGAEAISARSVKEALSRFEQSRPHAVISDIGMPAEGGFDLAGKLRAMPQENGGRIPLIALSAFAREEDQRRALDLGFDLFLCKPVEPDELVTAISSAINAPHPGLPAHSQAIRARANAKDG